MYPPGKIPPYWRIRKGRDGFWHLWSITPIESPFKERYNCVHISNFITWRGALYFIGIDLGDW